jgi:NAD(P)-dependent dehydrogenase (short-subunit alcohol dehydrogenase family)
MGALEGKRALITGGASGIGRAAALLFACEGAAVAVADLNEAGGQAVVDQIRGEGGRAVFVRCDVTQADDCRRAVEQTAAELGGLDVLFNNAGIIRRATVEDADETDWDRVMAVNVKSVFLMSKHAVPVMAAAGGGAIVNTASGWGLVGGQ